MISQANVAELIRALVIALVAEIIVLFFAWRTNNDRPWMIVLLFCTIGAIIVGYSFLPAQPPPGPAPSPAATAIAMAEPTPAPKATAFSPTSTEVPPTTQPQTTQIPTATPRPPTPTQTSTPPPPAPPPVRASDTAIPSAASSPAPQVEPPSCGELYKGEIRSVSAGTLVNGDVVVTVRLGGEDKVYKPFDQDGDAKYGFPEDTIVVVERAATVNAQWGASCLKGDRSNVPYLVQKVLRVGCGSACRSVRVAILKADGSLEEHYYTAEGQKE